MAEIHDQDLSSAIKIEPSFEVLSTTVSESGLLAQTESSYGLVSSQNIFDVNKETSLNLPTDSTSLNKLESPESKAVSTLNGANSRCSHVDCAASQPPTGQSTECPNTPHSINKLSKAYSNSLKLRSRMGSSAGGNSATSHYVEGCECRDRLEVLEEPAILDNKTIKKSSGTKRRSSPFFSAMSSGWRQKNRSRGKSQGESIVSKAPVSLRTITSNICSGSNNETEGATGVDQNGQDDGPLNSTDLERAAPNVPFNEPLVPSLDLSNAKTSLQSEIDRSQKSDDHSSVGVKARSEDGQEEAVLISRKTVDSLEVIKRAHPKKFKSAEDVDSGVAHLLFIHRPQSGTSNPLKSVNSLGRSIRKRRNRLQKKPKKGESLTSLMMIVGKSLDGKSSFTAGCSPKKPQAETKDATSNDSPAENRWVLFGNEHRRLEVLNCSRPREEEKTRAETSSSPLELEAPPIVGTSAVLESALSSEKSTSCCPVTQEAVPPALPPRRQCVHDQESTAPEIAPSGEKEGTEKSQNGKSVLLNWLTVTIKDQLRPKVRKLESFFRIAPGDDIDTDEEAGHESMHSPIAESAFLPSSADPKSAEMPLYSAKRLENPSGNDSAFLPIDNELCLALSPLLPKSKSKTASGWRKWSQAVKMCFSSASRARAQYSALSSTEGH